MIEKLSMTFDLAGVLGASALPVLQTFNISIGDYFKSKKAKTHEAVYTWTPLLVGVFACAFHFGFIDPVYFEEIRVAKPLPSGGWLVATGGEMLVFIALGVLATDIFKIWKVKRKNHQNRKMIGGVLSFIVFVVSVYLFVTSPNVSSSTFLILLGMCLLDMVLWFNVFNRPK